MGRSIDPDDPHLRDDYDPWKMYGQTKLAMRHFAVGLQDRFDRAAIDAKALSAQPGLTNSDLQTHTATSGTGGAMAAASVKLAEIVGMTTDRGALSQLRAATDPKAPGGGFYGPMFVSNGPPIRKPLVRPGSRTAIDTLWRVAEQETGASIDITSATPGD
jgi:hypothetical protein